VYLLETALRDLIADVLRKKYGARWEDHIGCSPERVAEWRTRRDTERRRLSGAVTEHRLLYYSDFCDLQTLVDKHWDDGVSECFGDKKDTLLYLKRLDELRNPAARSRDLLEFENDLVSGMTGELRQKVTLYHSHVRPGKPTEYFARIETVTDNFGRSTTGWASGGGGLEATVTVRVGDQIHFRTSAWDPDDGELEWELDTVPERTIKQGRTADFTVDLTNAYVGDPLSFMFQLRSKSRPYSRLNGQDDLVVIQFKALPQD
jgi:hypothetical protein